jgi:malonyl-CoA/methylmalonyl-CoA synthetase
MFDGYIRDHAHWTPRAPAVVTGDGAVSYAQFNADIDRFGAALAEAGVTLERGVVSICLDNPYLGYVVLAALARLGVASGPFNDAGADLRLVEDRPGAGSTAPGPPLLTLPTDWIAAVLAAESRPLPALELDPEAVGRVMLSSGTTRSSRRIAMTWRRIEAVNLANLCSRCAGMHGTFVSLTTMEAMQGYSLAICAWSLGAAVTAGIDVSDLPALMERWPPGLIGCTPAQLTNLIAHLPPTFQPQPGWRIGVGGSRLSLEVARVARLRITPDIRVSYGATEAPSNAQGLAADLPAQPGQVGVAVAGTILDILDDEGHPVPDGQPGEIRVRGARVADGYLDDPEGTAERFQGGGFMTRDIGRRLPDGRIVLEGRADDRMNLGGAKFMPSVLEEAAFACPGVRDCAAFAVPGPVGLDICWLAVVADAGFDRASLAPHLAGYPGLPASRFAWVDEIPRNAMGKIERGKLRDALLAAIHRNP